MGLLAPDDVPMLKTAAEVHVNATNKIKAVKLQRVCDEFPKVWQDLGLIEMPKEQMMKVPLVDGWQNAKLNCR